LGNVGGKVSRNPRRFNPTFVWCCLP